MKASRLFSAAALTAVIAMCAAGQTPPPAKQPDAPAKPDTPSAATRPTAPAAAPANTPPTPNPDIEKAIDELRKQPPDFEKALKCLKDATDKDKKLPPPKVLLAQIFFQTKNGQQGRAALEQAGAEDPGHPDPYILSAAVALGEGRAMDAMLLFERGLNLASDARWPIELKQRFTRTCREGLAQCYASRNEFSRALEQLKNILQDEPKNAIVRLQAARLTFLFGQHDLALEEFKKAFADDPKNPQINLPEVNIANMWMQKPITSSDPAVRKSDEASNLAKSEEWMKKAIDAHPKDVRSLREYGRWLMNHSRLDEADKQLAAAKALDANDNETNAFIGLAHRYRKQYREAREIFERLENANRSNVAYAWNYALCLSEMPDSADKEKAITIANQAAQANQNSPESFAVLAWCLFKKDRLDDADTAMGNAIRIAGGRLPPDNIYYLANILVARGKKAEARDKLKIALDSKDAFVYRADADALYKKLVGEVGEAKPEEKKP